jgi:hypothetical protein
MNVLCSLSLARYTQAMLEASLTNFQRSPSEDKRNILNLVVERGLPNSSSSSLHVRIFGLLLKVRVRLRRTRVQRSPRSCYHAPRLTGTNNGSSSRPNRLQPYRLLPKSIAYFISPTRYSCKQADSSTVYMSTLYTVDDTVTTVY